MAVFETIRAAPAPDRASALQRAAGQEGWLSAVIRDRLPRFPDGFVPVHFLVKRSQNLLRNPARLLRPKGILLLVAGFGFDLIVYVLAQIRMMRGTGAGHW